MGYQSFAERMQAGMPQIDTPPPRRGLQLAGALASQQPAPQTSMDTTALRRKALADALAMGVTDPINGDGSGMDWLQGLVRGGEAYFKTQGARAERESEAEKLAQAQADALEERRMRRQEHDLAMNKPVGVSPGEVLVNPQTGEQIFAAPDTSSTGPIRAVEGNSEVVLYDTRTGEEVGRRPIAPRPVTGRANANLPPLPPGFNIVTRR